MLTKNLKQLFFSESWTGYYPHYGKTHGSIMGWTDRKQSFVASICGGHILEQGTYKDCAKALRKLEYKKNRGEK